MTLKRFKTAAALTLTGALVALGWPGPAGASSHREAPAISNDPAADNTDLYAWVSLDHTKVYVIANWIPLEEPSGGPNFHRFSDDVRYELHVARGNDLRDVTVYHVQFHTPKVRGPGPADLSAPPGGGKEFFIQLTGALNQTYDVTKYEDGVGKRIVKDAPVAPPRIGPRTQTVGKALGLLSSATYDDAYAATFITNLASGEGRVWAGPRDDPFYVDVGGIFDLANLRKKGVAQDGLAGFNVHSIAFEFPIDRLTDKHSQPGTVAGTRTTIGLWAASSRRELTVRKDSDEREDENETGQGRWVQVSRLGIPLVNEVIIGYNDKDKYNRTQPQDDLKNFGAYFLNPVLVRDAEAVGIYKALGVDPTPFKSNRTDIVDAITLKNYPTPNAHVFPASAIGDVLRLDLAIDSAFPNGRPISPGTNHEQADVTDVLLSVILTKGQLAVSDGVDYNDKTFLTEFPFLALPWEGFSEGHGKPTP